MQHNSNFDVLSDQELGSVGGGAIIFLGDVCVNSSRVGVFLNTETNETFFGPSASSGPCRGTGFIDPSTGF